MTFEPLTKENCTLEEVQRRIEGLKREFSHICNRPIEDTCIFCRYQRYIDKWFPIIHKYDMKSTKEDVRNKSSVVGCSELDEQICPKCNSPLEFEDHSKFGGSSKYWICRNCGEEQIMFSFSQSSEDTDKSDYTNNNNEVDIK